MGMPQQLGRDQCPHVPTGPGEAVEHGRVQGEVGFVRYRHFDTVLGSGHDAVESPTRDPALPQFDRIDRFDRDPPCGVGLNACSQHRLNVRGFRLHRECQKPLRFRRSYISVVWSYPGLKDLVTARGRGTTLDPRIGGADKDDKTKEW